MGETPRDTRAAFSAANRAYDNSKRAFVAGPEHVTPDELLQSMSHFDDAAEVARSLYKRDQEAGSQSRVN